MANDPVNPTNEEIKADFHQWMESEADITNATANRWAAKKKKIARANAAWNASQAAKGKIL